MQIEGRFRFSLASATFHVDVSGPMFVRVDDDSIPAAPKDCCHSNYIAKPKRLGKVSLPQEMLINRRRGNDDYRICSMACHECSANAQRFLITFHGLGAEFDEVVTLNPLSRKS